MGRRRATPWRGGRPPPSSMRPSMNSTAVRSSRQPRIVITLADVTRTADPVLADDKNELYIAAIRRAGGDPLPLNERSTDDERRQAFAVMDGLLLSGGADIDPARYGQPMDGARDIQPERDQLEVEALAAADAGGLPVLGICRGLQALNAFRGGTLLQHVDGHETPDPLLTGLARHDLEIRPGTRLAGILLGRETDAGTARAGTGGDGPAPAPAPRLVVNTYHHQGVPPEGLAPGLVSSGTAEHAGGHPRRGARNQRPGAVPHRCAVSSRAADIDASGIRSSVPRLRPGRGRSRRHPRSAGPGGRCPPLSDAVPTGDRLPDRDPPARPGPAARSGGGDRVRLGASIRGQAHPSASAGNRHSCAHGIDDG